MSVPHFPGGIWLIDFEFRQPDGDRPEPICLVAREWRTGCEFRIWRDGLSGLSRPPFPTDASSLIVAYFVSAEMSCFLALGWSMPQNLLDLFVEFRLVCNGNPEALGAGIIHALAYYSLPSIAAGDKDRWRTVAMRGPPFTPEEKKGLIEYCASDVCALGQLLSKMADTVDFPRALLRGRYMQAVADMEWEGIPLDMSAFLTFQERWPLLRQGLIRITDQAYGVYVDDIFKVSLFEAYCARSHIQWPRLPSGALSLSDDVFRTMAKRHPELQDLYQLRVTLGQMRNQAIAVGVDGHNRCLLSPFQSKTGRNQPSTSRFIFGPAAWMRHFIKPEPGMGLAYIDYEQQEFGIMAALANDNNMRTAYLSGDPYLAFARMAGAVPAHATKQSHYHEREQFKRCALGVQYGMGAAALGDEIGKDAAYGAHLLKLHQQVFGQYWEYLDRAVCHAQLTERITAVFGWTMVVTADTGQRTLANFHAQANGAEMLRIACCLARRKGVRICAPIHDALLITAPINELDNSIRTTQSAMEEASRAVLGDFVLRSEVAQRIGPNDRFREKRGAKLWNWIANKLEITP